MKKNKKNDYTNITNEDVIKAFEDLIIGTPEATKRKFIVYTGCKTYGSINAMEFCGSIECSNCNKRAADFHEYMKEHVKNLFEDEEE